jgi:trans-AT polyketide synthase/acyltransferase/oxidoreductase domain-containing protein
VAATSTVLLFSGLGSHHFQMGRSLYDAHQVFRVSMDRMDHQVRGLAGRSVLSALFDAGRGRADVLDEPVLAMTGLFMVERAVTELLAAEGIRPDVVLGASAGMFAAAVAAGCLTETDALAAAVRVGTVVERHGPSGAMAAVLAPPAVLADAGLTGHAEVAAVNFDSHVVMAAPTAHVPELRARLDAGDVAYQWLAVRHPFHSRWIDPLREMVLAELRTLRWAAPAVPLVGCAQPGELRAPSAEDLWTALREPIRFDRAVRELERTGPRRYLDAGPSGTLATAVKYLLGPSGAGRTHTLLSPFGGDAERVAVLREEFRAPAGPAVAFMFPGQGSQRRGMGDGLFDEVREYAAVEAAVDDIVGASVRELCLRDPDGRLGETRWTQPCLYVVNALHHYRAVADGTRPTHLLGHSLGEYNALHAAGAIDLLDGLRLVTRRGELMSRARDGGMAAVVGLAADRIVELLAEHGLDMCDIANLNLPEQTVISGPREAVERAAPLLERAGARACVTLKVSAAFHSRYMRAAAAAFAPVVAATPVRPPALPVIANVTARPVPATAADVRSLLVRQVTAPVRWHESVEYLLGQGVTTLREIGPGNVLTRLLQRMRANRPAPVG